MGSWLAESDSSGLVRDGYDSLEDIEGYEHYAESFLESRHPQDTARIKAQLDREDQDRMVLQQSGVTGVIASLAAGVTDPIFLPLMLIPGSQLVKSGATTGQTAFRLGVLGAGSEAMAETGKQATQYMRTAEESLVNVTAAALLSGALGAGISALTREQKQDLSARIVEDLQREPSRPSGSAGAAEVESLSMEDLEIVSSVGLEKVGLSPTVRLAKAPVKIARLLAHGLLENPLLTKGAKKGLTPIPQGGATETRIKMWDGPLARALVDIDQQYSAYRTRVKGTGGERLNRREFYAEVSKANRRNDSHHIPEVSKASVVAREKGYNPLKDEAIEVGLFDKDVAVTTAPSYARRVYNTGKIIQHRDEWDKVVTQWIGNVEPTLSAPEIQGVARTITDNILGNSSGRIPYDLPLSVRGPLKERVFDIEDELIEDFLENDIELLLRNYTRTMGPDVELSRTYGSVNLEDQIETINTEFQALAEGKTPKERTALDKQRKSVVKDVEAMVEVLSNRHLSGTDPTTWAARVGRSFRDVNYLSKLGGMTVSAIPDIASIMLVNGVGRSFRGLFDLIKAPAQFRMSMKSARELGVGLDMVLNSRATAIADIDDVFARNTKFERGLKKTSNVFSKVALMAPWNAALKQFSAVVTQSRLLEGAMSSASGKLSKANTARLTSSGIDSAMAKRIAQQFEKYGEAGDLKLPQTHLWDDPDAAQTFNAAVLRDVDRAIVTPGAGEKPVWLNSEAGKMVSQFKSFALSAHHKILMSNLQYRDAQSLQGVLMMIAFGGVAYSAKQYAADRDISDNPKKLLVESIDRSGMLGIISDINNTVEKVSRGTIGLNAAIGESPMSRYASRNALGSALGPSFGTAQDIIDIVGDVSTNEMDEGTIRSIRKMAPFQNIFYIRRMLDSIEEDL